MRELIKARKLGDLWRDEPPDLAAIELAMYCACDPGLTTGREWSRMKPARGVRHPR
jgi:hypothetical protein